MDICKFQKLGAIKNYSNTLNGQFGIRKQNPTKANQKRIKKSNCASRSSQ
jgi:hypothetical protein